MIVKFQDGETYEINEKGTEKVSSERFDILVLSSVSEENIKDALEKNYKIFECKDNKQECLSKIFNIFFGKKKSCKFA